MRKLLLLFVCALVSIGAWAQSSYTFGTGGTVTISADGKSAIIHCESARTFNTASQDVCAAMANVESVTFDNSSVLSGTDLTPLRERMQNVKKLVINGSSLTGSTSFYVGNFPALEELVLSNVTSDKPIEIANNSTLKAVLVTPESATNVTFTNNSALKGIIKNSNVNTTSSFDWVGNYSTFPTIDPVNYTAPAAYVEGKTALKITGSMSTDDVANLNILSSASGEIRLLDMSEVALSGVPANYDFPFTNNTNLVSVVLPKGLPDAKAEWFTGCTNLYSAITYDSGITDLKVYINKPGSLRNTIMDFGNEDAYTEYGNWKQTDSELGTQGLYDGNASTNMVKTITKVRISGIFNSNDVGSSIENFDANGHVALDYDNVEYYYGVTKATGGDVGCGALYVEGGSKIATLDLSDAVPQTVNDLRLAAFGSNYKELVDLKIPTSSSVKELPRDFLNASDLVNIKTLCIPSNIEVIGARAFSSLNQLRHVYTTGTDETIVYDNGAVTSASTDADGNVTETRYYGEDVIGKAVIYGSITLSSNLKKIESFAFSGQENIKDVYVLALEAPECHVDAFSTIAYVANDAYDTHDVQEKGIITREAYRNGSDNKWMALLHYPRECTTPEIQRYTDVTRDYSVATGMRDGKGATLYFPNQSEYYRAFLQGTFGYVWDAWDTKRDGNNGVISPDLSKTQGHSQENGQQKSNQMYIDNTNSNKTDRAFYDVTLGDDNTSTLNKPAGLQDYWTVTWEGTPLYQEAKSEVVTDENGNAVTREQQKTDEKGNLLYVLDNANGTYVKVVNNDYVEDDAGIYVKNIVWQTASYDWNKVNEGTQYRKDDEGNYVTYQELGEKFWNTTDQSYYEKVENGYRKATDADSDLQHYTYAEIVTYREATSEDPSGDRYSPDMETVNVTQITKAYDYRGWHQFVLTAYAHNSTEDFMPYRSYITDNEWWTICMPFDLTKSEIELLFGGNGLPYVSKLTHVIRDIKNERITLMFSNNLMEYKETVASGKLHGEISNTKGNVNDDDVVIHKGVSYLIRPNLKADASRQFDIKPSEHPGLYEKLVLESKLTGAEQKALIYAGEYTVPSYVVNNESNLENVASGSVDFTMGDETTFTHSPGTIKYFGSNVEYKISTENKYTFVGSLYKSQMPANCYFLGWDSGNNCAAFWYNKVADTNGWNWNNNTGIIIPNFNTETKIHDATGPKDPARWDISGLTGDDIKTVSGTGAKTYSMQFGAEMGGVINGIEDCNVSTEGKNSENVYNLQGAKVGSSLNRLSKGVYIMNGKKYIVK